MQQLIDRSCIRFKETHEPGKEKCSCGRPALGPKRSMLDKDKCVLCLPNSDANKPCYDCTLCRKTREYLKDTDDQFQLYGYDGNSRISELWLCTKCDYLIAFEMMNPCLLRDVIHEDARRDHVERVCGPLRSRKSRDTEEMF